MLAAFWAQAGLSVPGFAVEPKTLTLKSATQVATEEIALRDLVVNSEGFDNIAICHAPLIGSTRILQKAEIAEVLKKSGTEYILGGPEHVSITRSGYKIQAEDLRPLIVAELKNRNSKAAITGIQLQASIFVADQNGLKLKRLTFDSAIQKYRAWFIASGAPHAVVFEAMATLDQKPEKTRAAKARNSVVALPVLVHRGSVASMQMAGEGFSATLLVTCLEDGKASSTIRVREQGSKLAYLAQVIGAGQLRALSREN